LWRRSRRALEEMLEKQQGVRVRQGPARSGWRALSPARSRARPASPLQLKLLQIRFVLMARATRAALLLVPEVLTDAGEDCSIRLWEVATGQCMRVLQEHASWVYTLAFSPNGGILASGTEDQQIRLWNVNNSLVLRLLSRHTSRVRSIAFRSDGQMLVSGREDQTTGRCLQVFSGHTHRIWSVALSADGQTIATGSEDTTVRLWSVNSGQVVQILRGHAGWIWSVAFSPDGRVIASGSDDGTIRLWSVPTGEYLRALRDEQPCERMDITGIQGISESQKATLRMPGAVEHTALFC
jgi:WD40 repeat protein